MVYALLNKSTGQVSRSCRKYQPGQAGRSDAHTAGELQFWPLSLVCALVCSDHKLKANTKSSSVRVRMGRKDPSASHQPHLQFSFLQLLVTTHSESCSTPPLATPVLAVVRELPRASSLLSWHERPSVGRRFSQSQLRTSDHTCCSTAKPAILHFKAICLIDKLAMIILIVPLWLYTGSLRSACIKRLTNSRSCIHKLLFIRHCQV